MKRLTRNVRAVASPPSVKSTVWEDKRIAVAARAIAAARVRPVTVADNQQRLRIPALRIKTEASRPSSTRNALRERHRERGHRTAGLHHRTTTTGLLRERIPTLLPAQRIVEQSRLVADRQPVSSRTC